MLERTGFYPSYIAFQTLLTKEVQRFMRTWTQTLLPPAITMSLYFIIFGKFIGSQVHSILGFTYIQYIVPGLVLMAIITSAYTNTAFSFFITKFNRSIEEMIVSPMSSLIMLLGFSLAGALRGLLVGVVVLAISLLFTHLPVHHLWVILLMAILSAMVFSLAGLINGIFAKRFDDISYIPTFVLTPLTYLGGVFYSINQLPGVWRKVSLVNPIFAMVDTFRYGILGVTDFSVAVGFGLISGLFLLLFFFAWSLLEKGTGIKV